MSNSNYHNFGAKLTIPRTTVVIIDENYEGVKKIGNDWYEYKGDMCIEGEVRITINLIVTGDQIIEGHLSVYGSQVVEGNQEVQGSQSVTGNQGILGNQKIGYHQEIKGTQIIEGDQIIGYHQGVQRWQRVEGNQRIDGKQEIQYTQYIGKNQVVKDHQQVKGRQQVQGEKTISGIVTPYSEYFCTPTYTIFFIHKHIQVGGILYTRKRWKKFKKDEMLKKDIRLWKWWKQWGKFALDTSKNLDKIYKLKDNRCEHITKRY